MATSSVAPRARPAADRRASRAARAERPGRPTRNAVTAIGSSSAVTEGRNPTARSPSSPRPTRCARVKQRSTAWIAAGASSSSARPACGQPDAALGADEQLDPERGLELADRPAQRRLRDVEACRRAPEVQLLPDRREVAEAAHVRSDSGGYQSIANRSWTGVGERLGRRLPASLDRCCSTRPITARDDPGTHATTLRAGSSDAVGDAAARCRGATAPRSPSARLEGGSEMALKRSRPARTGSSPRRDRGRARHRSRAPAPRYAPPRRPGPVTDRRAPELVDQHLLPGQPPGRPGGREEVRRTVTKVFSANFDASTQASQIQDAVTAKPTTCS